MTVARRGESRSAAFVGVIGFAIASAALGASLPLASALTPDSKEVKAAIEKGLDYLYKNSKEDQRAGAQALAGLAFYKNNHSASHPVINAAVQKIASELRDPKATDFTGSDQIYQLGLSAIFLANLDDDAARSNLEQVLQKLLSCQKSNGGWGYPNLEGGDTSMTQYGVLAMWEASRRGVATPTAAWEKGCNWLIRTQDPSGAFGYQGTDPGTFTRVPQQEVRQSMAAAGLGSLYVCRDQFDVALNKAPEDEEKNKLPSALKPVKSPGVKPRNRVRPANVDMNRLRDASHLGDAWMAKNIKLPPDGYWYYFLYALERYQSFRELADKVSPPEPKWYTDYAGVVLKQQKPDGSWEKDCGNVPDTAFAILFLCRSAKKSIQEALGSGLLVGGRGLPNDTGNVQLKSGVVVAKPLSGPADKMLAIIEDPANRNFEGAIEGLAASLEKDHALLPEHLVRLKKLAKADTPAARAAAIKALSRTRDLDNVPLLIFALNDKHWDVVKEARDGLRFMSRKFETMGPVIPCDEPERRVAIQAWKDWYLTLRPDHRFDF